MRYLIVVILVGVLYPYAKKGIQEILLDALQFVAWVYVGCRKILKRIAR